MGFEKLRCFNILLVLILYKNMIGYIFELNKYVCRLNI